MLREKVAGYGETLEGRQTRTVVDDEGREHVIRSVPRSVRDALGNLTAIAG